MFKGFTRYQAFVVLLLAFLQFSVVVDFMMLSPLGALLLHELHITPAQFGLVVSVYAFSAGAAGFLTAGFADRFDRRNLLLFFYAGFVLGTFLCGIAPDYPTLLGARIVTGLFGGVIGSISYAIIADLFPMSMRGRVMGVVQTSFAASQVLGIPVGLFLSDKWGWHMPFLVVAGIAALVGILAFAKLRPIDGHLHTHVRRHPLVHLWAIASKPRHLVGFSATILLTTGGFMLMPFGSAFSVNNLGIEYSKLPLVYMATGACSLIAGPWLGRLGDRVGKFPVFVWSTLATIALVLVYTRLGITPLWGVILVNIVLFAAINGRIVSASALNSGVPEPADRGGYMSVNSSIQQISGGVASMAAGMIVVQTSEKAPLANYPLLGVIVAVSMVATILLMRRVNQLVLPQERPVA
ncbi:MAG: MFS transporter [Fibrobacteria bacterium]|nr:MFS transporter [Fibrobacteria bacterium]